MSRVGLFALAASRVMQVRRRTWVLLGVALLALFGLSIWAVIALLGWFFGLLQGWGEQAPAAARGALATVERQVEQVVPGAREKIAELVPAISLEDRSLREVSGTDIAPVPRYPGLVRTHWQRDGRQITVQYEGRAELAAVLDHYSQGFAALGYTQELQSATAEAETHGWSRGQQRYGVTVSRSPKEGVVVRIETRLE